MTVTEFFNQELIKNHLLFSIYDVDEFVLREVERIKSSNTTDIWDVSKAKRYSFEIHQVGKDKHEEDEISTEDYLYQKQLGTNNCFTRLNYEDFQENFPLDDLQSQYSDEWLINFHYDKAFLPNAIKWIEEAGGDKAMSLRIKKIIKELKRSQNALENIKYGWHTDIPLNDIQKAVIEIFKRFDEIILKGISEYFKADFPNIFKTKKGLSKEEIIGSLINKGFEDKFYSYEYKLDSLGFLSEDRNKWLKESSDLVRFYNYCEEKGLINRAYKYKRKGINYMRELYDYKKGTSIDESREKRLKQNDGNVGQFNFLDII